MYVYLCEIYYWINCKIIITMMIIRFSDPSIVISTSEWYLRLHLEPVSPVSIRSWFKLPCILIYFLSCMNPPLNLSAHLYIYDWGLWHHRGRCYFSLDGRNNVLAGIPTKNHRDNPDCKHKFSLRCKNSIASLYRCVYSLEYCYLKKCNA